MGQVLGLNSEKTVQASTRPAIDTLPSEVLGEILIHLSAENRLSSALTCRRWAEVVSEYRLLKDVQLVVRHNNYQAVESILMNTQRHYTTPFEKHSVGLWTVIAENFVNLTALRLYHCSLPAEVIWSILGQCSNLESLEFEDFYVCRSAGFDLSERSGELQEPLRNLRHLSLRYGSGLEKRYAEGYSTLPELTDTLIGLMPNLVFLTIVGPSRGTRDPVHHLRKLERKRITFKRVSINDEVMMNMLNTSASTLEELRLDDCELLTEQTWSAIQKCTELRRISLSEARDFRDEHLETILFNATKLNSLDLGDLRELTSEPLKHICNLRHLRKLTVRDPITYSDEACYSLGKASTLHYLDLRFYRCDIRVFRRIANLSDLRTLIVRGSPSHETPECFDTICKNLGKLERLEFECIESLTDADGVKLLLLKKLRYLRIGGVPKFTEETFREILGLPAMKTLICAGRSLERKGLLSVGTWRQLIN